MVVLKKIKGATLMETMVATVLIVIIFMIASLVMNSLIRARSKANQQDIAAYLNKLEYHYSHGKLEIPYAGEWKNWEITITAENGGKAFIMAENQHTKKKLTVPLSNQE